MTYTCIVYLTLVFCTCSTSNLGVVQLPWRRGRFEGGKQSWKTSNRSSTVLVLAVAQFDLSYHLLTTSFYSFQALQYICVSRGCLSPWTILLSLALGPQHNTCITVCVCMCLNWTLPTVRASKYHKLYSLSHTACIVRRLVPFADYCNKAGGTGCVKRGLITDWLQQPQSASSIKGIQHATCTPFSSAGEYIPVSLLLSNFVKPWHKTSC